jgi:hypothetical protein
MLAVSMSVLAAVAATALSASQAEPLLVIGYQSLGVDAAIEQKLGTGFRAGSDKPPFTVLGADKSDASARAAVMCGEDAACLATVGQRSGAKYVLAYGVGKVGTSLLVSALFIDVAVGKEIARASKRVLDANGDWIGVTKELADLVVKPPAEPLVVQVPVPIEVPQKQHRFRTPAFAVLGVAIGLAVGTTAIGLGAMNNFGKLEAANTVADRQKLAGEQRGWNAAGDTFLVVSILTAAVGVFLLVLDARDTVPVFETAPAVPTGATW